MNTVASLQCYVVCEGVSWFPSAPDLVHWTAVTPLEEASQLDLGTTAVYIRPPPTATLSHTDRRTTTLPRRVAHPSP